MRVAKKTPEWDEWAIWVRSAVILIVREKPRSIVHFVKQNYNMRRIPFLIMLFSPEDGFKWCRLKTKTTHKPKKFTWVGLKAYSFSPLRKSWLHSITWGILNSHVPASPFLPVACISNLYNPNPDPDLNPDPDPNPNPASHLNSNFLLIFESCGSWILFSNCRS